MQYGLICKLYMNKIATLHYKYSLENYFRIGNEDAVGTTYGERGRNIDEALDVEEEEVKERKYAENVYST